MRSWMHVLRATTACSPYGPFRTFDMGLSTSCQLFKSCPAHCLRLRLPEWLPGDLWHSEQLVPWRAPCLSFCAVRRDLQHYQHNDSYQQCLGKAQKHIQGHDCIEATQFGIRCEYSGLTHTVHILVLNLGKSSNQPAVPGIGPKVVDLNSQANPSLRPAFSHTNGFLVSYLLYFAIYCLVVLTNDE